MIEVPECQQQAIALLKAAEKNEVPLHEKRRPLTRRTNARSMFWRVKSEKD
jgi:hypothetical protein